MEEKEKITGFFIIYIYLTHSALLTHSFVPNMQLWSAEIFSAFSIKELLIQNYFIDENKFKKYIKKLTKTWLKKIQNEEKCVKHFLKKIN